MMRVRGEGPSPADVMLVSDYPGREEDRTGRTLSGRTGRETDRFLNGYDLPHRRDIYLTNLYKLWYPEGNYPEPLDEQNRLELLDELARVQPKTIITLGRHSARWFLGDVDLEDVFAIPWEQDNRVIFPVHNPAAGFHNAEMQNRVTYGFEQASQYLKGKIQARRLYDDLFPNPVYLEITDPRWFVCLNGVGELSIDTEGHPHRPWSIQFCVHPGTSYIVCADHPEAVAAFLNWLAREKPIVVYHSALHDRPMLRALAKLAGVSYLIPVLDTLECEDTMVMSYLLQLEPQGLKPLCVRHCGMRMQSYDEVLGDAGFKVATDYLVGLYDLEQLDWEINCHEEFARINATPLTDAAGHPKRDKLGAIKYRKTTVIPPVPKTPLHKSLERCLRSQEPRRLWGDQVEDIRVAAYAHVHEEMPEPTLDLIPRPKAVYYGCRDSDGTTRVKPILRERVESMGLGRTYQLEMGTYPLIDRMGTIGITPDLTHFAGLSDQLAFRIADLQVELEQFTGREGFNANSGDQVAELLFDHMGLDGMKTTRGGRFSTNDKILEALEKEHGAKYPVITTIRDYREVYKLKHTFVDRIPDFIHRYPYDGRVHSTFRTTRVVTGRLAASDPNLLAQPKHGKFARDFRRGWVARPGHVFASWDESQVELRVLADLSQDPKLLEAFRKGLDLHGRLADRIFGGGVEKHKKGPGRLAAKAVNFGIPMGMTASGLTVELRKNGVMVTEDDAQRWLDETMALYKEVPKYQDSKIAEARRNGYVRCMSGRIRYVGGIKSFDDYVRGEAERFAFSTPIQEGAQLIMKTAEWHVWNDIIVPARDAGRWIEPICQIHDDLLLETGDDQPWLRELDAMMRWAMTETYQGLSVPLDTSGDAGYTWCTYDKDDPHDGDMREIES